jgi:hypothetical protein
MADSTENKNETKLSLFNASINVKMDKLGEPIEKLIDACSRGTGIAYLPRHIKKLASASKYAGKQLDLSGQEIKELFGASFLLTYGTQNRQHKNIQSITQKAIDALPDTVDDKPVDEDWIAEFFEHCKNVGSEEMQILWGRLLAGEVAEPGSFSKRTLDFVKSLSTEEAQLFTGYCRLLMTFHNQDCPFRMSFDAIDSYLKEKVSDYEYWGHLSDIGLVHNGGFMSEEKEATCHHIHYFDREFQTQIPGCGKFLPKILFSIDRLTMIGIELFHIAHPEPDYEYFNQFLSLSEQNGIKITVINSDNKK